MTIVNFYAGGTLDRATPLRKDSQALAGRLARPQTRILAYWRGRHLVASGDDTMAPLLLSPGEAPDLLDQGTPLFLGLADGEAYFALDVSMLDDISGHPALGAGRPMELRPLATRLDQATGSLLAYVQALMNWRQRHRFCGTCGSPTEAIDGGHALRCTDSACAAMIFPRTDPVVIMLVHDGDRCLLGRQGRFPPGWYSALAGFVEPGESLEEAVAREVQEEAGIRVADVRYHSSQPWPFPASLMLGFHARATSREIRVDQDELEDAQWFERDWMRTNLGSERFRLPPREAIARQLIDAWLEDRL
jgi:NAD+ diphosphatase